MLKIGICCGQSKRFGCVLLLIAAVLAGCSSPSNHTPTLQTNTNLPSAKDDPYSKLMLAAGPSKFPSYDREFIDSVRSGWYQALNMLPQSTDWPKGKVALEFHLHADGRITDIKVIENTVGQILGLTAQRAILNAAPYESWSATMRHQVKAEYRVMEFNFYYDSD
jgi:hypothetical protein